MEDFFVFASEQWLLVSVFLGLIAFYFWNEKRRSGQTLTSHEATRLLNSEQAVLIDLRDTAEYKAGHINDSINIPFAKLKERLPELEKYRQKTVILVDKMGQHTGTAGRDLGQAQFQVARLAGGITEWQNQKLPVVRS